MTEPKRAALYARVSTDRQESETQLHPLRKLAADRGWTVVGEFVDEAVSGRLESRPELDRLMEQVVAGEVDVVAVWRLDRLGRSLQHLIKLIRLFQDRDVDFVVATDATFDTTTPMGKLAFHITAAFAEFESALLGERVKAGIARRKAEGKPVGRQRVEVNTDAIMDLLGLGYSLSRAAKTLGANRNTAKARLEEAGLWDKAAELLETEGFGFGPQGRSTKVVDSLPDEGALEALESLDGNTSDHGPSSKSQMPEEDGAGGEE